jgi:hypothetical protein
VYHVARIPLKASLPVSLIVAGVVYQPLGWSVPVVADVVVGSVASRSNPPTLLNAVGLLAHGSVPAYDQV